MRYDMSDKMLLNCSIYIYSVSYDKNIAKWGYDLGVNSGNHNLGQMITYHNERTLTHYHYVREGEIVELTVMLT